MSFNLSEELIGFRDVTRSFAADKIAPYARQWDADKWLPNEVIAEMGRIGLLGVTMPEAYGGAGQGLLAMTVVVEEIARQCGGTALMIAAHSGLCSTHINIVGSQSQKEKWLPKLAVGEVVGSWCLSEPDCGSDAEALTVRAEKTSAGWVLNGQKHWITNGKRAGVYVVIARTKQERGARTISAFIVERDRAGLIIGEPEDKMGMRASDTVPVTLENCEIPE
jgi:alkylation response protein AidB-like acyl-CoA dehydrogenase